jgi:hypothetical protein
MSHREKSYRRRHSSSSSESDHHKKRIELDSDSSVEIELYSNKHKKNDIHIEIEKRGRSRSRSSSRSSRSSSSSSSSSIESKHKHHKKHNKHEKHSSSDSEHKDKCSFDEIYKYYKYRLLTDDELMAGGSTAFVNNYWDGEMMIPDNYGVELSKTTLKNNIDLGYAGSPYFVREAGVYILFFILNSDQASQFAFFVNGLEQPLTRYGNNSGAGQLVLRAMIRLKKDDALVIRNSESSAASVNVQTKSGGLLPGNPLTFLMMKVAPYHEPKCLDWDDNCLSKKKLYLFKKLLEKMLLDKDLMLKGFDVRGSFFRKSGVDVPTENDVPWESNVNVNGLLWNAANPERATITEDGIYKLFYLANTNGPSQFAFCVNGVPVETTTEGVNKGAGQVSLRTLLDLKKNDYVTVRNHTSVNSKVVISGEAGGVQDDVTAILTIFKITPTPKPTLDECKLNSYHKKCYLKFKQYLLHQKCLQIAGSSAYFSVTSDTKQVINVASSVNWDNNVLMENVWHHQGTTKLTIQQDGIYDIFADIATNEPAQWTLFINGTPNLTTTFGRDSGAARTLVRQFVKLMKGDIISVRNFESHAGPVSTITNAGGDLVGQSAVFMAFRLCPLDECNPCLPPPPHPPQKPDQKCETKCDKPKKDKK